MFGIRARIPGKVPNKGSNDGTYMGSTTVLDQGAQHVGLRFWLIYGLRLGDSRF